jgi:hypothetical protein
MEDIQEKRRLVLSHKEGLKDEFLKNKSGFSTYNSKFRTQNSKQQNEKLYMCEAESLDVFLDDLDSMQISVIEDMKSFKKKMH